MTKPNLPSLAQTIASINSQRIVIPGTPEFIYQSVNDPRQRDHGSILGAGGPAGNHASLAPGWGDDGEEVNVESSGAERYRIFNQDYHIWGSHLEINREDLVEDPPKDNRRLLTVRSRWGGVEERGVEPLPANPDAIIVDAPQPEVTTETVFDSVRAFNEWRAQQRESESEQIQPPDPHAGREFLGYQPDPEPPLLYNHNPERRLLSGEEQMRRRGNDQVYRPEIHGVPRGMSVAEEHLRRQVLNAFIVPQRIIEPEQPEALGEREFEID